LKGENTNQEEILKEKPRSMFFSKLRDRLKEIHIESGRSILEGGKLSNPLNRTSYGINNHTYINSENKVLNYIAPH